MNKKIKILLVLVLINFSALAQLSTTNLPIIKIQTSQAIVDTYSQAQMDIIDNASGTNNISDPATFSSMVGAKLRGSATVQAYPKKSYSIETWTSFNVNNNVSVLGLPVENDWVLLAEYPDRSLLRGLLALDLHNELDRYAPRLKYCELLIDNVYQGVYLFGEKIKQDTSRVNIAKLRTQDNFGEQLTGGYILNIDNETGNGFNSSFPPPYASSSQFVRFLYEYPKSADITPAQEAYIKSYIDSFEIALNGPSYQDTLTGWRAFGANNSFIDYIIVNELSKNYDAYRVDMYMYKDKSKKLRPGPMWGFSSSFANTASCLSATDTGYAFRLGQSCSSLTKLPSFWWERLMSDSKFAEDLKCRYTQHRASGYPLDSVVLFQKIDSFANLLNAQGAQTRNFTLYPIFGTPIINEPVPMATNYAGEIANIKAFIRKRLQWLDAQWVPTAPCFAISVQDIDINNLIEIYPNPASDIIHVNLHRPLQVNYALSSITGQCLEKGTKFGSQIDISIKDISKGIYLLELNTDMGKATKKIMVE